MIKYNNRYYVLLDDFEFNSELRNTFIGLILNDKRIVTHPDYNGNFYYDLKTLNNRLRKFKSIYEPKGFIKLCEFREKSIEFYGYVSGSKTDKIVLPLYKKNGVKIKIKKWVIYKEIDLIKKYEIWKQRN